MTKENETIDVHLYYFTSLLKHLKHLKNKINSSIKIEMEVSDITKDKLQNISSKLDFVSTSNISS